MAENLSIPIRRLFSNGNINSSFHHYVFIYHYFIVSLENIGNKAAILSHVAGNLINLNYKMSTFRDVYYAILHDVTLGNRVIKI